MKLSSLVLIGTGVTLGTANSAVSAEKDRLREILEVVKGRVAQYNPVLVKYHVETVYTPYYAAAAGKFTPSDTRLFSPLKEARVSAQNEYAQNGLKQYARSDYPMIVATTLQVPKANRVSTTKYDGKVQVGSASDGMKNTVSITKEQPNPRNPLLEYSFEQQLLDFVDYIDLKNFSSQFGVQIVDQPPDARRASVKLTITQKDPKFGDGRYDFWFGPRDRGYPILHFERRFEDGLVYYETADLKHAEKDGIWYTTAGSIRYYCKLENTRYLSDTHKFAVDSITFRAKDIPDSLFDTTVPPGTTVIDRDRNNAIITDPVEAQKAIAEAVAAADRPLPPPADRRWLWYTLAALCVVVGFVGVRRIRRGSDRRIEPTPG